MSDEVPPQPPAAPPAGGRKGFRWQTLLQRVIEPVFVLDRRRRLLFVNPAWERLTGHEADRVRGLPCRRPRPVGADAPAEELLAHLLTPPPESAQGQTARVRRLYSRSAQLPAKPGQSPSPCWWDLEFFPLRQDGAAGCLFVGRIIPVPAAVVPGEPTSAGPPLLLPERLEGLRLRHLDRYGFALLHSVSPAMQRVVQQVRLTLAQTAPVLLVGEPGSGKRTVARVLHYQGPARERALACLDARLLPASAVADVLFADRGGPLGRGLGAIYLAGPDRLPRELQARLCETIAAGTGSPRLLFGIEPPVPDRSGPGALLDELYWLISAVSIELPPLRQRRDDLPHLVETMLAGLTPTVAGLTPGVWQLFREYAWPGNLRQLRQVLEASHRRAVAADPPAAVPIDLPHLPSALRIAADAASVPPPSSRETLDLEAVLTEVERRLIRVALKRAGGNRTRAAQLLGIHRPRLLRRMQTLGLEAGAADPTDE